LELELFYSEVLQPDVYRSNIPYLFSAAVLPAGLTLGFLSAAGGISQRKLRRREPG